MTNQKKTDELLEAWTELKTKLQKLICLSQYKILIKDAVESYLLTTSSLTSIHSDERTSLAPIARLYGMPVDYQFTPIAQEKLLPRPQPYPGNINYEEKLTEWKSQQDMIKWNAFLLQKEKNEKIVAKCKELLEKLR